MRPGPTIAAAALLLASALGATGPESTPAPPEAVPPAGEPAVGAFLVARRQVDGPVFGETVVWILRHGERDGAFGLIVNRPTGVSLAAVGRALPEAAEQHRIHFGGPVEPDTLYVLIRAEEEPPEGQAVVPGVWASNHRQTLDHALAEELPPGRFRVYAGYSGWTAGQLEHEIERGDWLVVPGDPDLAFGDDPTSVWRKLFREHEVIRACVGYPTCASIASSNALGSKPNGPGPPWKATRPPLPIR